jgi:hypothetical protein
MRCFDALFRMPTDTHACGGIVIRRRRTYSAARSPQGSRARRAAPGRGSAVVCMQSEPFPKTHLRTP